LNPYPFRLGTASFSLYWLDSIRGYAAARGLSIQAALVLLAVIAENLRHHVQPGADLKRRSPDEADEPRFSVDLATLRVRLPGIAEQVEIELESLVKAGWVRRAAGGYVAIPPTQDTSRLERFRAQYRGSMVRLLRLWISGLGLLAPIGTAPGRLRPKRIDIAWTVFAVRGASAFSLDLGCGLDPALALLAAMKLQCGFGLDLKEYPNAYRMIWDGTAKAPVAAADLADLFGSDTARLAAAIDRLRGAALIAADVDGRLHVGRETLSSVLLAPAHRGIWRAGADLMSTASLFGLERLELPEALGGPSHAPPQKSVSADGDQQSAP
jgi:hypothetical protein